MNEAQKEAVDFFETNKGKLIPRKTTAGTLLSLEGVVDEKRESLGIVLPAGMGHSISEKGEKIPGTSNTLLYVAGLYQISRSYESPVFDHLRKFIEQPEQSF